MVLALLGTSAGLAGLSLVFLGLVVTTYQSFDGATPAPVLERYRRVVAFVLAVFVVGAVSVLLQVAWFADRRKERQALLRGGMGILRSSSCLANRHRLDSAALVWG